jgi:hypothetical protein
MPRFCRSALWLSVSIALVFWLRTASSTPLTLAQEAVVLNSMIPDSVTMSLSSLFDKSNLSGNTMSHITSVQNTSSWTSALNIGSFSGLQAGVTINGSIATTTAPGDNGSWSIGSTVGPRLISGNGTANFEEINGSGGIQITFHNVVDVNVLDVVATATIDAVVIGQESDNFIEFVDTPTGELTISEIIGDALVGLFF